PSLGIAAARAMRALVPAVPAPGPDHRQGNRCATRSLALPGDPQRFPGRWVIAARRRCRTRPRPAAANPPGAAAWPRAAQADAGTESSRRPCAGARAGSSTGGGLPRARAVAAAEGAGVGGGELPGAGEEVVDDGELVVGVGGQQVGGGVDEVAEDFLVAGVG